MIFKEVNMRELIQSNGSIVSGIVCIIGCTHTIMKYRSSSREETDLYKMFEGLIIFFGIALLMQFVVLGVSLKF